MNLGFDESHFRTEQWTYKVEMTPQRNGMSWWSWRLLSEFQALFLFGKKSYSIDWNFFFNWNLYWRNRTASRKCTREVSLETIFSYFGLRLQIRFDFSIVSLFLENSGQSYKLLLLSISTSYMEFDYNCPYCHIKQRTITIGGSTYHCTADLIFDWFGFDQIRKSVVHSA